MKRRKSAATLLRSVLLACLLAGLSTGVYAAPAPAPSAFGQYPTYGIGMSQDLASGERFYTLTLDSGAYLLYMGNEYPIVSIWGFFAVNKSGSGANSFTASGPSYGEWAWDQHPNAGNILDVAGWLDAPKNEALVTPASGSVSKAFTFGEFSFTGTAPVMGLHVTVAIPAGLPSPFASGGLTGNIIPERVPEPSGLLALLGGTGALGSIVIRRRK